MILESIQKYPNYLIKKIYKEPKHLLFQCYCYWTRKVTIHSYAGVHLKVYIHNAISKLWYDHDEERNEIKYLQRKRLKSGARVFNIGAHDGIIALVLSKLVGKFGSVIAVEMDINHVKIARINKKNNKSSNLNLVNAAVGDKNGEVYFDKDQVSVVENNNRKKIKILTLDYLTKKFGIPDVIYIDVEGYEVKVLEGGKKTLGYIPDAFIEVHVKNGLENFGGSIEDIVSFFPKEKYSLFMASPNDQCSFQPFSFKSRIVKDRFYFVALKRDKII